MQKPNLGGLLGPYFTPVAGSAATFLQMYQTVVEFSTGTNIDLCFVLLSKVRVIIRIHIIVQIFVWVLHNMHILFYDDVLFVFSLMLGFG